MQDVHINLREYWKAPPRSRSPIPIPHYQNTVKSPSDFTVFFIRDMIQVKSVEKEALHVHYSGDFSYPDLYR